MPGSLPGVRMELRIAVAILAWGLFVPSLAPAACGDTVLDVGEECDDGNTSRGDCCLPDCRYDPVEAPCGSEDICDAARLGVCDGVGACIEGPTTCRLARWHCSSLSLRDEAGTENDRLRVRNFGGRFRPSSSFVTPERIGDPSSDTRYALCAYDAYDPDSGSTLLYGVTFEPSALWKPATDGWSLRYGDRNPLRRASVQERRLRIVAEGAALSLPGPVGGAQYFPLGAFFFFVGESGICAPIGSGGWSVNTPTRYETIFRCLKD
jgi:cysteine-rich repeat protein